MRPDQKPYKVVGWPGDKAADVIDRQSGERVGFVLANFYSNWQGRLIHEDGSITNVGGLRPYRQDAAGAVWREACEMREEAEL